MKTLTKKLPKTSMFLIYELKIIIVNYTFEFTYSTVNSVSPTGMQYTNCSADHSL